MNLGAGRVVYQSLTRIDKDIEDGGFYENAVLVQAAELAASSETALHVLGLMSPGGIHSHEDQIMAALELADSAVFESFICMPFWTAGTPRPAAHWPHCSGQTPFSSATASVGSPPCADASMPWTATTAGTASRVPTGC